jgi:hypothetical protein
MVAITVPSVAVAADIDEPDNWGEEVFNYSKTTPADADPPGDLEAAFISYDESDDTVQFRINFTNEAPQNPMSDNITQIYIDSDLDSETGLNNETYTDGSDAEKFYNNTDNIGADYRVSIGAGTDLVAPWDEGATQFIGGEGESIDVENRNNSVIANVPQSAIDDSDTFDLKFVYLDTSDEVEGVEDYTWAPDADDEEINSTRFSTESDTVVPQATIEAVINISDDAVDEDATVDFTLNDDSGDTTQREGSVEGNNNITETFTVDARDFAEGDGTLRAEIDGENYTLDAEKEIPSIEENDVESKVFDPHGLIDISGNVSGLSNTKGGEVTISVNKTENNEATVADQTIEFDGESDEKPYRFTLNATNFTDGGVVEAELDAGLNTISADSNTNFQTSRYNPTDKTQGFTVNDVGQTLSLETNLSEVDVFTDNGFNITVTASSDGTNGEEINTVRHRIEYDTDQLSVSNIEYLVSPEVKNITSESYGREIVVTNQSALVSSDSSENLYNITFKLNETVDPNQGANVNVTPTTRDGTRLFNSSSSDRELEFDKSAETVTVTNSETRIQNSDVDVTNLTVGGNMVGSPTKFDVEVTSVNDGKLANIILYNERTGSVSSTIDCDSESECSGTLSDVPSSSTYLGSSLDYEGKQRYNITAYPSSAGDPVVTNKSVTVYKEADVNGDGGVGIKDIRHIVNNRDQEAEGGLPWNNSAAARSDVNNDGDVDIVDITIVTEKY